jgi:putative SOS response-associated peptidase YedK
MCGRAYSTYTDEELELRYLNERRKRRPLAGLEPNFNLAPTQLAPVVFMQDHQRTIELMRFGLVPFWAKDIKSAGKYSLINAKAEEIDEKRSYKEAFLHRRCIIPLSGFYEWQRTDGAKRPFAIHLRDGQIMSVAGVWEYWQSKDTQQTVDSFSIITTAANSLMQKIHNRMPVVLDRKDESTWLDPDNHDIAVLKSLLKPCPSEWLEVYEISTLVNSPKNNTKKVLDPLAKT